jgi:hypothetical protein
VIIEAWNRFWYRDEPSYDPMGLIRIAAVFFYARFHFSRDFHSLRIALDLPVELIPTNLGLRLVPLPYPLPADSLDTLQTVMLTACGLAFIGSSHGRRCSSSQRVRSTWHLATQH